ncbi:hypothetical protein ABZ445_16105 [Streptomyces chartreusis]|uniref:hypothetical protein n=1 Tax=Streptomyces chartreusis TaxID=1969 RepID=UPI00340B9394
MPLDIASLQTLDLEAIEHETEPALIARGAAYAREYAAIEDKPTILAMNVATVLLALRRRHGDMLGKSHAYRVDANEVYTSANIPDAQRTRLQANVRYHIGNMLRRVLTPRELKALDLIDASPLERQQDRRATDSAILKATRVSVDVEASTPRTVAKPAKGKGKEKPEVVPQQGGSAGMGVKATADHLRLAHVASNLVGQLDADVIDSHMTDGQRAKLDEELAVIESAVRRLRRQLKKSRSEG